MTMKTVAAIAFAFMIFALPVHSAESAANVETVTEVSDNIAFLNGRCARWRNQVVCAF